MPNSYIFSVSVNIGEKIFGEQLIIKSLNLSISPAKYFLHVYGSNFCLFKWYWTWPPNHSTLLLGDIRFITHKFSFTHTVLLGNFWLQFYFSDILMMFHFLAIYFTEAPFGHIPILSVDGTEACGSVNIARFIGERHGKFPWYGCTIMLCPIYIYTMQDWQETMTYRMLKLVPSLTSLWTLERVVRMLWKRPTRLRRHVHVTTYMDSVVVQLS